MAQEPGSSTMDPHFIQALDPRNLSAALQCAKCNDRPMETELIGCRHRFCAKCFVEMYDGGTEKVHCEVCPQPQEQRLEATGGPQQSAAEGMDGLPVLRAREADAPPSDFVPTPTSQPASAERSAPATGRTSPTPAALPIDYCTITEPSRVIRRDEFPDSKFWGNAVTVHPVSGDIYIADSSNNTIHVFDGEGERGSLPGQFTTPWGIATTDRDEVIIADTRNQRIQILTLEGQYVREFGRSQLSFPSAVAYSEHAIYVADYKRIEVFALTGEHLRGFGHTNIERLQGVAVSGDRVITSDWEDDSILIFTKDGSLVRQVGGFRSPWGVAVDAAGHILVADSENSRIQVLSPDGDVIHTISHVLPLGVAVTPRGGIAVVDPVSLSLY